MKKKFIFLFNTIVSLVLLLNPMSLAFAQKIPNDPMAQQWSYKDIGVYNAWDYTTGSSDVIVAVIDNGIDMLHPDLEDNMWKNLNEIPNNLVDDDKNGYIDDVWGWNFADNNNDPRPDVSNLTDWERVENIPSHGTLVAGLIGAVGNNGLDGVGLNWRVKIMNLKILGNSGEGESAPLSEAIRYAMNNGADIINVSAVSADQDNLDELKRIAEFAYRKGVFIVAAAGNDMNFLDYSPLYPVCLDASSTIQMVMGVSAIEEDHYLARFSNTGASCIDITAPGVNVSSTIRFSPTNGLPKRYEGGFKGTSFASPLVAGAAALIKSIQPNWKPVDIFKALTSTVHHTPSEDEAAYAELYGSGLLQIDKAVKYAIDNLKSTRPTEKISVVHSIRKNNQTKYVEKFYSLDGEFISENATSSKLFSTIYQNNIKLDFDHDGKDESVVSGKDGRENILTVYDNDGSFLFDFMAYKKISKGKKVEMLAADFNGDNYDDLITFVPGEKLIVWSLLKLQKIGEWSLDIPKTDKVKLFRY